MHNNNNTESGIIFIEDNDIDAFLQQQIFHRYCKNYKYSSFKSAQLALDYLKIILFNNALYSEKIPEYIFLGLNSQVLNGYEFLDEFEALNMEINYKIKVIIMTTSINPDDAARCLKYTSVKKFITKPLYKSSLSGLGLRLKSKEEIVINDHIVKSK